MEIPGTGISFLQHIYTKTGQYPVPLTQDENRLYQKLQRSHPNELIALL